MSHRGVARPLRGSASQSLGGVDALTEQPAQGAHIGRVHAIPPGRVALELEQVRQEAEAREVAGVLFVRILDDSTGDAAHLIVVHSQQELRVQA